MFSNDRFIELNFDYFYFLFYYSWFLELQSNQYKLLFFLWYIIIQLMFLGALFFIFAFLIVDLFVCIDRISINLSWNLSRGVIANCLWVVSKLDIRIFSHLRFVEGCGKGAGWVFRLVCFNLFLCLIQNILQVICSILILLIVGLCL